MYGFVLIVVLIVTGGVIAFIGDRVGSRVGKKKLSLFGLRPRHTSVIVTVVTGILITTLTFVILAGASDNVRTALFGMDQLNRLMGETKERLQVTAMQLADAKAEQQQAEADLTKSKGEIDQLHHKQTALEDRAKELAAGNAKLEDEAAALQEKNQGLTEQNATLMADNAALEEHTDALRRGLQFVREGNIVFQAGEVIASGIVRGGRPLEDVLTDMGTLIQLANRNTAQRLGVGDERSEIWIYQPEYEQAARTIAAGGDDMVVRIVAAGNLVLGEPVRTNLQLFKNRIVYQKDEFIIARPFKINGHQPGEAEQIVMAFLKDVNAAATAQGILPDPLSGSVGIMEGSQFYDIVQALIPLDGMVVLSAYARADTDALGPLRLNLKLESDAKGRSE
ncbi:MAG: DUF3084 domain-containing protein [Schwartzia sp. (in: firmicutes)]